MRTTRYQNEPELSRLLSESRLSITSRIFACLLKNKRAGKLCSSVPLRKFSSLQRLNGGMNFDDEKLVQTNLNHENNPYSRLTGRLSLKGLQPFELNSVIHIIESRLSCVNRSIVRTTQNNFEENQEFCLWGT